MWIRNTYLTNDTLRDSDTPWRSFDDPSIFERRVNLHQSTIPSSTLRYVAHITRKFHPKCLDIQPGNIQVDWGNLDKVSFIESRLGMFHCTSTASLNCKRSNENLGLNMSSHQNVFIVLRHFFINRTYNVMFVCNGCGEGSLRIEFCLHFFM